ncbi:hypothetical protein GBA52_000506 [Prunus armeniaca]|nr:hypothetical protein GBA52_000506 [Prunus armeniaca]
MVKQVGAQARKDGLFDHVITAKFTQNPDLMKIQGQLSDMLGLQLHGKTELRRAAGLKKKILSGNKTLIILDDIWNASQNLTSIGIPSPIELQGCNSKVLLTTRRLNVCHVMKSHVKVHLDVLSEEDSWNLFTKESGRSFESGPLYDVARKVAGECAGLPIALITVARALGDKDSDEWEEAARRLEMSQTATLEDEGAVFKCIKLSFDYLKGEDAKSCFLLCSLFAEGSNIAIQDLFSYGFGYGLFRDGNTLEGARAKARSVTKYLKASSLLLDGKSEEYVRMHDVIRDTAIFIAPSEEHGHRFLVKSGWELNVWPNDTDEGCSAISLKDNCISKLPDELCNHMPSLMNSTTLVPNRPVLEKLEELYVNRLNDLKELCVGDLPHGSLGNLKLLEVKGCKALEGTLLQPNLWQKLQNLEVLNIESMSRMEYVFESEGLKQEQAAFRNWREMELAYLGELKSIWNGPPQYAIFHNLKVLTVSDCRKLKTIFTTDASLCLMQLELEELRVDDCSSLETIIGANEGTLEDKIIFPQLRYISLRRLPELKSFYSDGSGGVECPSLEHLHVHECHSQFSISASDFHSQKQVQVDTGFVAVRRYVFSSLISTQSKRGFCVK